MSFHTLTMPAVSVTVAKDLIRISPLAVAPGAWADGSRDVPGSPIHIWEAVVIADSSLTDDQVAASLYLATTAGTGTAATAASWDNVAAFPGTAAIDLFIDTAKNATVVIDTSSIANPSVITTAEDHLIDDQALVVITGHAGSTPAIDGNHVATVTSATTFTIPVNVTVDGTGGIVGVTSGNATNPPLWRSSGSLPGGIIFTTDEPITVLPGQHLVLRLETDLLGATDITAYVMFENHF